MHWMPVDDRMLGHVEHDSQSITCSESPRRRRDAAAVTLGPPVDHSVIGGFGTYAMTHMEGSRMIRVAAGFGGAAMAALVAACGSSSSSTPTPTSNTAANSSTTSTTATTGGTATAGGGVNVTLDPCQLVTAAEASSLAGATFSTGTEQTNTDTAGGGSTSRTCVYGGATLNVFEVTVAQATDASTAQADWSTQQARVQSEISKASSQLPAGTAFNFNVNDTSVSGADKAATVAATTTVSGHTLAISGIYLLKGAVFVAFTDLVLGTSPPSVSAMESQAATTLGRV